MCNCIHDGFSSAYTIEGDVDFRSRRNLFGWHSPRVEWNEFHRRTGGVSPDVCKVSACAGWTPLSCKEKEVYSQRVMVSNRIVWDLDGEIARKFSGRSILQLSHWLKINIHLIILIVHEFQTSSQVCLLVTWSGPFVYSFQSSCQISLLV